MFNFSRKTNKVTVIIVKPKQIFTTKLLNKKTTDATPIISKSKMSFLYGILIKQFAFILSNLMNINIPESSAINNAIGELYRPICFIRIQIVAKLIIPIIIFS